MSDDAAAAGQGASGRVAKLLPIILIVSLFFLWGVANNLNDVLIKHFKKSFVLSDFQSGLVQSAFYFGYFCFAVPAAMFMKRFGYKAAVVVGLALFGFGALLFLPAASAHSYGFFLVALYVIASGLSFLETSANPLVTVLGAPETAERRLNLAQSFNPLGAITGIFIGSSFILSGVELTPEQTGAMTIQALDAYYRSELAAVRGPYLAIGLFVLFWAALVIVTRFPTKAGAPEDSGVGTLADYRSLVVDPTFMAGVFAQFAYVGAQVGIWSYMIRLAQSEIAGMPERYAANLLSLSLGLFLVGRFMGTWLMGRIHPARLLGYFAIANLLLCAVAAIVGGWTAVSAMILTSLFMSIMFPTIFAISLKGLGPRTPAGASLLVMAIIGGAVITALIGLTADHSSMRQAMLIPGLCFAVIGLFARRRRPG